MRLLPLLSLLFLAACAATAQRPQYLHDVPEGTVLSLERPLPFQADSLHVYLQNGKVYPQLAVIMDHGGANRSLPYCTLELRDKPTSALTLTPRQYVITGVTWDSTYTFFGNSLYRTRWQLSGGGQPAAMYFTCYRLDSASQGVPIKLTEVDSIVGDYFRLIPAKDRDTGKQTEANKP